MNKVERLRKHAECNYKITLTAVLAKLPDGKYEISKNIFGSNGKWTKNRENLLDKFEEELYILLSKIQQIAV